MPKLRQMMPLMVLPVVVGASLAVLNWCGCLPAGLWAAACVGYGVWMAVSQRNPYGPLAGVFRDGHASAWSAGFWMQFWISANGGPTP